MTQRRVALFVTCVVDQVMPEVGVATVCLLRRAGYQVEFPMQQTCCGQPMFNSGFQDEALKLVKHTIEVLEPYPAVVLPSGSCTTMLRKEYPHLLENDPYWYHRAENLAAKTFELSEFLIQQAEWQPERVKEALSSVTYHDSCHMTRSLGLQEMPREALSRAGCTITEMEESNRCCGFGGVFSMRMPEVSNAMTKLKLERGINSGCKTIVTADPGCLMQMRGLASDEPITVRHLALVLEEATR